MKRQPGQVMTRAALAVLYPGALPERDRQRLRAFVVLNEGAELTADDVKAYVAGNLARYKAPRDVVFVDELPRNPTGKVLKRVLREGAG